MRKGRGFVRQLQHGPRHVMYRGHLALLHHLSGPVPAGRSVVDVRHGLQEVAAQAQPDEAGGRLDVQNARSHLVGYGAPQVNTQITH